MLLFESIVQGWQSLKANPLRSILTLVGIAVGIAAVLYVVVQGEITKRRINEQLGKLGSNVLIIRPDFGRFHGVSTASNVVNLTWDDARQIDSASRVIVACVPTYSGGAVVEYEDKNTNTRITGTTPEYVPVNNSVIAAGRFFTDSELEERARVCILGSTVCDDLFAGKAPVGETVVIKGTRFEVIGLLGSVGESWSDPDNQVFVPLTTAQERLFGVDYLSMITAQIDNEKDYDEALFDIETVLRRNHRLRPDQNNDFRVRRQDFFLSTIQETNTALANFIIAIAMVSLVVGGIGIANVMLVSVVERIREIGVRRAVGAKKIAIITQFIIESIVLGLAGGIIGILGGTVLNALVTGEQLIVPWMWLGYSLLICVGVGTAAGLYPAVRAANVDVIEALRYE